MPRFAVDYLDVLLELLRGEMPGVTVMSRIPDGITRFLPLVTIRRIGGDSPAPDFYDRAEIDVQCWAGGDEASEGDPFRAASDLADQVRGVLWSAYRAQRVVSNKGWVNWIAETSAPQEISDPDLPFVGRYVATYELRVRPVAA